METAFERVVQRIFNNWTALQLAVEHGMGGPDGIKTALEFMEYMVRYCLYVPNVDVLGIQNALDVILDEEFETICEDDSTRQIAEILYKFAQYIQENNEAQYLIDFNNLPAINKIWLQHNPVPVFRPVIENNEDDSDSDDDSDQAMEEDQEWTQVKSRRKR